LTPPSFGNLVQFLLTAHRREDEGLEVGSPVLPEITTQTSVLDVLREWQTIAAFIDDHGWRLRNTAGFEVRFAVMEMLKKRIKSGTDRNEALRDLERHRRSLHPATITKLVEVERNEGFSDFLSGMSDWDPEDEDEIMK
jgi:hypothetical protein